MSRRFARRAPLQFKAEKQKAARMGVSPAAPRPSHDTSPFVCSHRCKFSPQVRNSAFLLARERSPGWFCLVTGCCRSIARPLLASNCSVRAGAAQQASALSRVVQELVGGFFSSLFFSKKEINPALLRVKGHTGVVTSGNPPPPLHPSPEPLINLQL